MAAETQAGERYATQVGELWSGLSLTLTRLETIAASPESLGSDDTIEALRCLQYRLHSASESVVGLTPPAAAAPAHTELGAALEGARDAIGEVIDAIEEAGDAAVSLVLHEWRGALFRVRLARLRLDGGKSAPVRLEPLPGFRAPLLAFVLSAGGAAAFAVGAAAGPWPLWVAGMVAVCSSLLLYRP